MQLLDIKEAERYLAGVGVKLGAHALRNRRKQGLNPKSRRIGKKVYWGRSDLDQFIAGGK